jgi:hypothetical protein
MTSDLFLLGILGMLILAQMVPRMGLLDRPLLFWLFQFFSIGVAIAVISVGVPSLNIQNMDVLNWVLGLLILFRVVQNNMKLMVHRRARQVDQDLEEEIERAEALAAEEHARLDQSEAGAQTTPPGGEKTSS